MQQYIIMGAKGAGNPVEFMGSLSVSHLSKYIYFNRGAKGATEKNISKWHKMT